MRTIGVLGGITWHSAAEYYRLLNSLVNERAGGMHAARCVLVQRRRRRDRPAPARGRWEDAGRAARRRRAGGRGGGRRRVRARLQHTARRVGDDRRRRHDPDDPHRRRAGGRTARDGRERVALLGTTVDDGAAVHARAHRRARHRGRHAARPTAARADRPVRSSTSSRRGVFSDETRAFYIETDRAARRRRGRVRVHRDRRCSLRGRRRRRAGRTTPRAHMRARWSTTR